MVSICRMLIFVTCLLVPVCGNVVINEVASRGGGGVCAGEDWVEIFNNGTAEANIGGYRLCDNKGCADPNTFTFPTNSKISGMGYLYVCKDMMTPAGFNFGISGDDTVTLEDTAGKVVFTTGALKGRGDSNQYKYTYAMLDSGSFDYVVTATPGKANDQTLAHFLCAKGQPCWNLFDDSKLRSYNIEITQANIDNMGVIKPGGMSLVSVCGTMCNSAAACKPCQDCLNDKTGGCAACWEKDAEGLSCLPMCDNMCWQPPSTLRDAKDEVWVPCIVTINYGSADAERFPYGGCRFKGSIGAWLSCDNRALLTGQQDHCRKLSLKFDANYFNKSSGEKFHGLKKLQMHSMHADNSLMRERLAYGLMQRVGFFVPRAVHASLFINGKPDGVRLLVEHIDDEFLESAKRLPGKIAKASTLYKELWVTGCADKVEGIKCSDDAVCKDCNSCIGDCQWRRCEPTQSICLNGKWDAQCTGKPNQFILDDGGMCYVNQRVSQCPKPNVSTSDCALKYRKQGSGNHGSLFESLRVKAKACMGSAPTCTKARATEILSEFMNMTSVVDALVATLLDMDQFTTLYSDEGHNFYTLVTNHTGKDLITMIPWDFDRGLAACVSTKCMGGGQLGDTTFIKEAGTVKGGLKFQTMMPWGRCKMPPWFANMKATKELNQKYCIDRVWTFAPHMHASCEPVVHLMGLALKSEYAARMAQFLDGASEWAHQRITQWRSQIRPLVEEDAEQGGFPTVEAWDATLDGLKARVNDVLATGHDLAVSAKAAAEAESTPPSASATQCFLHGVSNQADTTTRVTTTSTPTSSPATTISTTAADAPSPAQTSAMFTGSITMSATGLNESSVETATRAAIATHFNVSASTVSVTVTKSRRLSADRRKLADTWTVEYEFSAPAAKVAAVEAKVAALATADSKASFKSVVGAELIAAGATQSSVDSITVTTAMGSKAPLDFATSGQSSGAAGVTLTILALSSVKAMLQGMLV